MDAAPTEIYTLTLHDALPIGSRWTGRAVMKLSCRSEFRFQRKHTITSESAGICTKLLTDSLVIVCFRWKRDRKSTRLNSSHQIISYAVFCLKKKITL